MSLRTEIKKLQRRVGVKADGIFGPVSVAACHARLSDFELLIKMDVETVSPLIKPLRASNFIFDQRTERNLSSLTAEAQRKFRPFMAEAQAMAAVMGFDYYLISGFRSYAEQNALYAQGRTREGRKVTNARGGHSWHNFGDAGDMGVFRGKEYLDADEPDTAEFVHRAVAAIAGTHGIEWGGNWKRFKDFPHFQVRTGMTLAQKRKAKREGRLA